MYNGYLKYMQSVHVLYIIMTNIHLPIGARLQSCMCILYIKIQPIEKIINRAFISLDLIYKEQNSYTELPQILCNVQNYNFLISKKNDRTFKLLQFFTTNLLVLLHENCKIVNMYIEISRYVYRLQVPYTRQQGHVKYM